MTTKTTMRYSSRNRTAADLEVLDQQFKVWLDAIAAALGHGATTQKGGVMMVGGGPYGMGTITGYQVMPEDSTIMVEMADVSENVAMMSMKAIFKVGWAKQVAKHNTGDESIMIRGMVKLDDPRMARALVEMFVEATASVVLSASKLGYFEKRYGQSASVLRNYLGEVLTRNRLVASSSDVVLKTDSYVAMVESGAPYGVGSVLIKGALSRVVDSYTKAGKPVPKMATLKKTVLSKVDKVVDKALDDFKAFTDISSTYIRSATWKGDDVDVSFMLSYKSDGKVRPPHLMGHIASSNTQIRLAYAQLMYKLGISTS